jgi:hypothetical protein
MNMSNDDPHDVRALVPFIPKSIAEGVDYAKMLSRSIAIPEALRGKPEDVFAIMAKGLEMDIPPMQALSMFHVIKGKVVTEASGMVAQCVRYPKTCLYFRLAESTEHQATFATHRKGHPEPVTLTYTIEDAQRAGLASKDNWKAHTKAMLRARCAAQLARAVYPDLVGGIYAKEEFEGTSHFDDEPPKPQFVRPPTPEPKNEKKQEAIDVAFDPVTGEVPPPSNETSGAPDLEEKINLADSPAELDKLLPDLQKLPENDKPKYRALYSARRKQLQAA